MRREGVKRGEEGRREEKRRGKKRREEKRRENQLGYCILSDGMEYYTSYVYIFQKAFIERGRKGRKDRIQQRKSKK